MAIKSWSDVDEAIKQIGRWQIKRDRLEGRLNEQITKAKEAVAPQIEALDAEIARLTEQLELYCRAHRAEMQEASKGGGLSFRGAFGKVAFRKCPPAIHLLVKNVEKVLAALKARKLTNCIRMVEEPNKEAMALLDDETLAAVGARRAPAEKFEVKPDFHAIATKEDAA